MKGEYAVAINEPHVFAETIDLQRNTNLRLRIARILGLSPNEPIVASDQFGDLSQIQGPRSKRTAPGVVAKMISEPPSPNANGPLLEVSEGLEVGGVRLVLDETAIGQVSGTLRGLPSPIVGIPVYLHSLTNGTEFSPLPSAVSFSNSSGQFAFPQIPQGAYHVRVDTWDDNQRSAELEGLPIVWGDSSNLQVGAEAVVIDLELRPGVHIRSSVRAEGAELGPSLTQVIVAFENTLTRRALPNLTPRPDQSLPDMVVGPGRYTLRPALLPDGWFLDRAMVGSQDISISPLVVGADREMAVTVDIVLTADRTSLVGTVSTPAGETSHGLVVVACLRTGNECAYTESSLGIQKAFVGANGWYSFSSVKPGMYWVAAFHQDDLPDSWPPHAHWTSLLMTSGHSVNVPAGTITTANIKGTR
jgi:hypothetical protein